ncbi:hypothetical protein GF357_05120 [Candidatus Dojkabacteria bacterium]|nr:hypothetical protein [Candidatus Dojkabacteria bacterium]
MYFDLKFFRLSPKNIKLPCGDDITIPLFNALQEAYIVQEFYKLNFQHQDGKAFVDLTDMKNALILYNLIEFITGKLEKHWTSNDIQTIILAINIEIITPIAQFYEDPSIKKFLGVKEKNELTPTPEKTIFDNFKLLHIITTVMSKINIPTGYEKFFGLRFFLLAQKAIETQEENEKIKWIPYLSETGRIANCYTDWKKSEKPYSSVYDKHREMLGMETMSTADGISGIFQLIDQAEKAGENITNKEYLELKRKQYMEQSKKQAEN